MLTLLAGFVVAPVAVGATGKASSSTPMGTANINVAGGTNFGVAAHPVIFASQRSQQDVWDDAIQTGHATWPSSPLDVYTIGCWRFSVDPIGVRIPDWYWKCQTVDSGPATDLNSALAQTGTGTIGTSGLQCSWLFAYDPVAPVDSPDECNSSAADYSSIEPGVFSPVVSGDMMPNLDPYVGRSVTFNITTNWCSYIAPPGYDVAAHNGFDQSDLKSAYLLGCASAAGDALDLAIELRVGASSYDCHVPRLKGVTLHKAKLALRSHHCSVGHITRVKGRIAGRVKFQPLPVGTGRPKGYRVDLTVTR